MDKDLNEMFKKLAVKTKVLESLLENLRISSHEEEEEETISIQWKSAIKINPEDDQTCFVSWWDEDGCKYHQPIRAYFCGVHKTFFPLGAPFAFPLCADIWCEMPTLPEEKI